LLDKGLLRQKNPAKSDQFLNPRTLRSRAKMRITSGEKTAENEDARNGTPQKKTQNQSIVLYGRCAEAAVTRRMGKPSSLIGDRSARILKCCGTSAHREGEGRMTKGGSSLGSLLKARARPKSGLYDARKGTGGLWGTRIRACQERIRFKTIRT